MSTTREEIEFITRFRTEALNAAAQAEEALRGLGEGAGDTSDGMEDAASAMELAAAAAAEAGAAFAAALVAFRAVGEGLQEFAEFETAMVNVAKVADLNDAALAALGERFEMLAVDMGIAVEEFTEVAAVAGQLGVNGVRNIALFTETVVALGGASNLVGEEGATVLARLLNVTGENIDTVGTLASVLVELGNNAAATEAEIAHMATAIAQSTAAYGTTTTFASALGAAMAEMGLRAEISGTSIGRFFTEIAMAAAQGGESAQRFADVMGTSVEQFRRVAQANPQQTYLDLLEAMSGMSNSDVLQFLDEMGLANAETLRTITPLIENYDRLTEVMALANAEANDPQALQQEMMRARNTLARDYVALVEAARTAIRDLGETWAPVARAVVQMTTEIIQLWNGLPAGFQDVANVLLVMVPAVASLRLAFSALSRVVGLLGLGGLVSGLTGVATGAGAAATAVGVLRVGLAAVGGPLGLAVTAGVAFLSFMRDAPLDLSRMQAATDDATESLRAYREAAEQAASDQERLSGMVSSTTLALLQQGRARMQEDLVSLREELARGVRDVSGGMVDDLADDLDEMLGMYEQLISTMAMRRSPEMMGASTGAQTILGQALGLDEVLPEFDSVMAEISAGLRQAQAGEEFDVFGLTSLMEQVRGVGPELLTILQELAYAAGDGDQDALWFRADELVEYASQFEFLTAEVDAFRNATDEAGRSQALINLRAALVEAYVAAQQFSGRGQEATEAMQALGETSLMIRALEAQLAGNEAEAAALAEALGLAANEADDLGDSPEPTFWEAADSAGALATNLSAALSAVRAIADEQITDLVSRAARAQIRADTVGDPVGRAEAMALFDFRQDIDDGGYGLIAGGRAGDLAAQEERVRSAARAAAEMEEAAREADRAWRELQSGGGGGGGGGEDGDGLAATIADMREEIRTRQESMELQARELELMRGTTAERAEARAQLQLMQAAQREGINIDREMAATGRTYREEIEATARAVGELAAQEEQRSQALESARERQEFFNQAQETLKEGILDAIMEGENLIDVLGNLTKAFARAALEAALFGSGPFGGGGGGLLGGLFDGLFGGLLGGATSVNAKGNVFYQSAIVPMAKGGRALLAEAGPEAIMPLDRAPDGTLGVRALGGAPGAAGMTVNYAPTFNIYSDGSVDREGGNPEENERLMRILDDSVRATVLEVLQREMNSGGMFNPPQKLYG